MPSSAKAGVAGRIRADDSEASEEVEDEEKLSILRERQNGPQLRDEHGFCYFGPAEAIHALLNVDKYRQVVPLGPLEELHASSVQHPRFPAMRWLTHNGRVPVLPRDSVREHAEHADGS